MVSDLPGFQSCIPNPLKPKLRYPQCRQRLTTVIAVRCRDGIILCADSQETNEYAGLGTKEIVSKIYAVNYGDNTDEYCVLGCSGLPAYINQLRERVGEAILKREGKSYTEALEDATVDFSHFVYSRKLGYSPRQDLSTLASAIFVGYEPKTQTTHMYLLAPPDPPDPLSHQFRATTGTGGLYASLLFNIAEVLMRKVHLEWDKLNTTLVAQFCYMVLGRITNYDSFSGLGINIYRIDHQTGKREYITAEQMFPGHGTTEKYRLSVFLKTVKDEILQDEDLKQSVLKSLKDYKVLDIIADVLSEK